MTATTVNPYLKNNFAPIKNEVTADELTVIGQIPPDLSGMFVRNGPNPQFPPIGQYHWFDGDGMLHGIRLQNGKASYLNRYIRTKGFMIERETGRALWTGLMEPPQQEGTLAEPFKNTANTALVWHANKLLALWEGGAPHQIQTPSLETVGKFTFDNKLTSPFTAHPKVDPETGEMLFFGYSFQPPFVQYGVVSPAGELVRIVPIEIPEPVMMHDFAVTQDYTIFMDLPLIFSIERMQRGESLIYFNADRPSRFGIVPRHGTNQDIRWFESDPCYVFHTLNAYQNGDEVVLLACRMNATTVLNADESGGEAGSDAAYLYQWRFNLKTGEVKESPLDDRKSDFPRINEQFTGRKMRYGYTGKMKDDPMPLFEGILKYDLDRGTSQLHNYGRGRYGGEAVFAPKPNASAEDEGWLITFVHDEESNQSELVIVDAQNMTAEPVARVIMPQRVPYGFHGIWVAEEE
ncbi:MAG: carotenoid oxygenase family protein [Chroococcales cyanobacterium]